MTQAEIIAAAREIAAHVGKNNTYRANVILGDWGFDIAAELTRLHDGAAWSSEPPTDADWLWWKPTENANAVPCKNNIHDRPEHGLFLRAEPSDAATIAELRVEVDSLKNANESIIGLNLKESATTILSLKAELAEARKEVDRLTDESENRFNRNADLQSELVEVQRQLAAVTAERDAAMERMKGA